MDVALESKRVVETNLIRVSYCCISCYFCFNTPFKQLYTSNKAEHFSYKGGCGGCIFVRFFIHEVLYVAMVFKERIIFAVPGF